MVRWLAQWGGEAHMTILTFPTVRGGLGPAGGCIWRKLSNTQVFESPLTRSVQTLAMPGARWAFTGTWQNLTPDEAARMRAFLYSLRGRAGRFYLHNFARPTPAGTLAGTPRVAGAGQTGSALLTDGWGAGGSVRAGDFVGLGDELRMVVADAVENGAGVMTLTLDEPVRSSPADDLALNFVRPVCVMRLTADDVESSFQRSVIGALESFTLNCVETWS